MAAANLDITIEQGATWNMSLKINTCVGSYNLTDCVLRAHIRRNFDFLFLVPVTIEILNAAIGSIKLSLTDEQTLNLDDSPASWDLFLTTPAGDSLKLIKGAVTIIRANTK